METTFDANNTDFMLVIVFGRHIALYTHARIDRETVPEGLFVYEVSHDPDDDGELHYIAKKIRKWFAGTLISNTEIPLPLGGTASIEDTGDFDRTFTDMFLEDYILCCPPNPAGCAGKGEEQNGKPDSHM